jgi:hypothetical protein
MSGKVFNFIFLVFLFSYFFLYVYTNIYFVLKNILLQVSGGHLSLLPNHSLYNWKL